MRNFENTTIASLSAKEYQRQAKILLPLQQRHMSRLMLSGIIRPLTEMTESWGGLVARERLNEGTRLFPIRNKWLWLGKEHQQKPLKNIFEGTPVPDDIVWFLHREDTRSVSRSLKVGVEALYGIGYTSRSQDAQPVPAMGLAPAQLDTVIECGRELAEARDEHGLTMVNGMTLEVAWTVPNPPKGWKPLDWN